MNIGQWVILLISLAGLLSTLFSCLRSISASKWPMAEGELLSVSVAQEQDSEDGSSYEPIVAYRYKIGNTQFRSSRFGFGFMASSSRSESANIVRKIIEREPLRVYYHPRKPELAVLLTGIRVHYVLQSIFHVALNMVCFGRIKIMGTDL